MERWGDYGLGKDMINACHRAVISIEEIHVTYGAVRRHGTPDDSCA